MLNLVYVLYYSIYCFNKYWNKNYKTRISMSNIIQYKQNNKKVLNLN